VDGATGLPSRWTFYIGSDGRIVSIDTGVRVRTSGTDIEQTLRQLQSRTT
jgi:peroxiredoxin